MFTRRHSRSEKLRWDQFDRWNSTKIDKIHETSSTLTRSTKLFAMNDRFSGPKSCKGRKDRPSSGAMARTMRVISHADAKRWLWSERMNETGEGRSRASANYLQAERSIRWRGARLSVRREPNWRKLAASREPRGQVTRSLTLCKRAKTTHTGSVVTAMERERIYAGST